MTPAARVQAAIDILDGLAASRLPADRFIREFFRARRYAGSKDRAAVSERVYDVFRHRASFAWRMGSEAPRALVIASLLKEGADVPSLFTGDGYGPALLTDEERARILVAPTGQAAAHIKGEYPEFLQGELTRAFGEDVALEMSAMLERAPVDLRVNTLKATHDGVLEALKSEGFEASAARYSPFGIRLPFTTRGLEQSKLFLDGAFEFQDEAAQVAMMLAQAKPNSRVLDLAAGAGGKSLALAAAMNNIGELTAHDIDEGRLRQIAPRAGRAGVSIIQTHAGPKPPGRPYDLVLLDAPCSGSGTWRRSPENKWRLTPERLDQLNALQDTLLDQAAARAAGKARIVYATCSILPRENEDRVAAFLERHPAFKVIPAADIWRESTGSRPPPGLGEFLKVTPLVDDMDGFFTAVLQRTA
ncbi:MAG: RsmB/NOP family class I SAM-dependent RNA methyltransferase [Proteobacteria bacterium]|nr:RsmB/NOP family class I SAM-dependent RNA methyltransferase [Pseudomonadota bacterium]